MSGVFDDVKVGDVFFTYRRFGMTKWQVLRVTPARFYGVRSADGGEYAFSKKDGKMVGYYDFAFPFSPERMLQWQTDQAQKKERVYLGKVAKILDSARGDEAIRLAALLPNEIKEMVK